MFKDFRSASKTRERRERRTESVYLKLKLIAMALLTYPGENKWQLLDPAILLNIYKCFPVPDPSAPVTAPTTPNIGGVMRNIVVFNIEDDDEEDVPCTLSF